MARRVDGRFDVEDSLAMRAPATGALLRDTYLASIPAVTFGLVRARGGSLWLGPVELLRFGDPRVTEAAVEWPIAGGWAAGTPGGSLRLESKPDRLHVSVEGYRPALPAPLYMALQLPVHRLVARLFMLRMRGRTPAPGPIPARRDRYRAAAIDLGFCAAVAVLTGRRGRIRRFAGIAAGYHVACWSLTGRTLGGLTLGQRVVAIDGSRLSVAQAMMRLLAIPFSLARRRNEHDEIACTEVIAE